VGILSCENGTQKKFPFRVSNLPFQVNNLSFQVGNLSPKGCIAARQFALVCGQQFVLPNGLESNCHPKTEAELPYGNVMFRRNSTYLVVGNLSFQVGDLSPKGFHPRLHCR
jgi:hypothetical protein